VTALTRELDLPPADPPAVLFHGTPVSNIDSIRQEGLRSRSRHHVHLSKDVPTARAVGRRRSAEVAVFEVAAAAMAEAGHVFQRSENGVWLTASVPAAFLSLTG
jgi:putative RNA 2'-phosphotransferase